MAKTNGDKAFYKYQIPTFVYLQILIKCILISPTSSVDISSSIKLFSAGTSLKSLTADVLYHSTPFLVSDECSVFK
jgi:hypothetical protein